MISSVTRQLTSRGVNTFEERRTRATEHITNETREKKKVTSTIQERIHP